MGQYTRAMGGQGEKRAALCVGAVLGGLSQPGGVWRAGVPGAARQPAERMGRCQPPFGFSWQHASAWVGIF